MKKKHFKIILALVSALIISNSLLDARPVGREGRGKSSSHASKRSSRGPSLSREGSHERKGKSQARRTSPQNRPQEQRKTRQRANSSHQGSKDNRQHRHRDRPKQRHAHSDDSKQRQHYRDAANRVRNQIDRDRYGRKDWFKDDFFRRHNYHPNYYRNNVNWWAPVTWYGVSDYLGWDQSPDYYDYQDLPDTYFQDPYYINEPEVNPYFNQIPSQPEGIQKGSAQAVEKEEWMPLGVFVAGKDTAQASVSSMFVQLAVNKNGDIAGTYYNASTDQTHPLQGMVDKEVQLVTWEIADNPNSPRMMTGMYNLTQDVANIKVQFPNKEEQDWVLVRLNQ
jgi:hypothetical protein